MEPRQLLAVAPLFVGAVYIEEDIGSDGQGDAFEITFKGGADGTELTRISISGDQNSPGFNVGDAFFDTSDEGLGADHGFPLTIVALHTDNPAATVNATVADGGTLLVLDLIGFRAGDKLVFTIDVDEVEDYDPSQTDLTIANEGFDPITSGVEFQGSTLVAEFSSPRFHDAVVHAEFRNRYDAELEGTGLSLPGDDHDGKRDRTAAAIGNVQQKALPVTVAGTVYLDTDVDLEQDPGEIGLEGVDLELWKRDGEAYTFTGHATKTNAQGEYEFGVDLGLEPGIYQVREHQPAGLLSVGAIPGQVDGKSAGATVEADRDILTEIALELGGQQAVNFDFAETQPAAISGYVYHDRDDDGRRDSGEEGIGGVAVQIVPTDSIAPQVVLSATTDSDGSYRLEGLMPGTYRIVENVQPTGYLDGLDTAGTVAGEVRGAAVNPGDSIAGISLGGGQTGVEYNFGELVPATIRGTVRLADRFGECFVGGMANQPVADAQVTLLDQHGNVIDHTRTDELGSYVFGGLAPGTYSLVEVTPDGLIDGQDHIGTVDGVPVGTLAGNDRIVDIQLFAGQEAIDYDFCEHVPAQISGYVFHDRDNDGIKQAGQEGIGGVLVTLLDPSGVQVATTTTDDLGFYQFRMLRAGVYTIEESQPASWIDGLDRAGTIDGHVVGSAAEHSGDRIDEITLRWGDSGLDYNFGELRYAAIEGSVHLTGPEGDCYWSGGPPLAGVTVELLDENGSTLDETITGVDGSYRFGGLLPGTYAIREWTPVGLTDGAERVGTIDGRTVGRVDGNDTIANIVLLSGQLATNYDFCEHEPASVAGYVYHDADNDGLFDVGEQALSGVTVLLLDAAHGVVDTAVTDTEGHYEFAGLNSGSYEIQELQPAGFLDGLDTAGRVDGNVVGSAQNPGDRIRNIQLLWGDEGKQFNFGELLSGRIEGSVHTDSDGDCEMDDDELPLADVIIQLLDGDSKVVATSLTDAAGHYRFDHLTPGTYAIREQQPAGYLQGGQCAGSGGGDDSLTDIIGAISVRSGQHLTDYDFKEVLPSRLSGYVFQDGAPIVTLDGLAPANLMELRDGRKTPDDTPLPGIVLELRDGITGIPITGEMTLPGTNEPGPLVAVTDENGYYEFRGLPPREYAVRQIHPRQFIDGIDTPGSTSGTAINANTKVDQAILSLLRFEPKNDAIIGIPLQPGAVSENNNFSEVVVHRRPIWLPVDPPPIDVSPTPVAPVIVSPPPLPPPPAVVVPPPQYAPDYGTIGSGGSQNFSWHLSVIDAGAPRGAVPTSATLAMRPVAFTTFTDWNAHSLHHGRWILARGGDDGRALPDGGERVFHFGVRGGTPVVGDFNGDGVDEIGVYHKGYWFLDLNGNGRWDDEDLWAMLGEEFDLPVTGDWNGDGKDDIGIFGPAWLGDQNALAVEAGLPDLRNRVQPNPKPKNVPPNPEEATNGLRLLRLTARGTTRADLIDHVFRYGAGVHIPVTGDWSGDGIKNIGVFQDGRWHLDEDGNGRWTTADCTVSYGQAGDLPVVGDFDGDGIAEIGVYRQGTWIVDMDGNRQMDAHDVLFSLGDGGDLPVVGDWDGDGTDDPGVYRPEAPVDGPVGDS